MSGRIVPWEASAMFLGSLGLFLPRCISQTRKWEGKCFYLKIAEEFESLRSKKSGRSSKPRVAESAQGHVLTSVKELRNREKA